MVKPLDVLVYRCLHEDLRDVIGKYEAPLRWAIKQATREPARLIDPKGDAGVPSEMPSYKALDAILEYYGRLKKLPNPDSLDAFFDVADMELRDKRKEIMATVQALETTVTAEHIKKRGEPEILCEKVSDTAQEQFYYYIAAETDKIITAGRGMRQADRDAGAKGGKEDAKKFILEMISDDYAGNVVEKISGVWQDNAEKTITRLENQLHGQKTQILLGFPTIDEALVMQKGEILTIAGYTGDGKTMLLMSIIYNMLKNGERVLLNSLEFDAETVWDHMAFLYAGEFGVSAMLGTPLDWKRHNETANPPVITVSPEQEANMKALIRRYKTYDGVPGALDVCSERDFEKFKMYYEIGDVKHNYTVVVIDFVDFLNTPDARGPADQMHAMDLQTKRVIAWAKDKKKFLFVTPAQIKKSSYDKVTADYEKSTTNGFYERTCLSYAKALTELGDWMISVFSPVGMRKEGKTRVQCLKHRGGQFDPFEAQVDGYAGYVTDPFALTKKDRSSIEEGRTSRQPVLASSSSIEDLLCANPQEPGFYL
jgi:RecA/RadA recombinase